ncbi:MAG: lytic transglycosylase domain-containing protein [Comamonadaceae bacterium]|nr:lytic transglycosylase domain-containing protein [Comamonadaceae bacterium]
MQAKAADRPHRDARLRQLRPAARDETAGSPAVLFAAAARANSAPGPAVFGRSPAAGAAYDRGVTQTASLRRSRVPRVPGRALLLAGLALLPVCGARAELWGYVDADGVAHLSTRPHDSRYRVVHAERPAVAPRVPGKRDGAEAMLRWIEIAPEAQAVAPWVREAARAHGVDAELLTAVIAVESKFRPDAVSPAGAIGLMQITAPSAERYATPAERRRLAQERLLDARTNIHTGARMLADLVRRYDRIELALAAWNAGEGTVRRHGGVPRFPETRAHVHLVLELYWALLQNRLSQRATGLSVK